VTLTDSEAQPEPTIELELGRLRDLTRTGRYAESLAAAEALAATTPGTGSHRDILYVIAANQRCLNRIDAALATLERLEQLHPRYGRLFQERGYCFVARRDARRSIEAFQRAVSLDPALPQSWSMLERLHVMTGDKANYVRVLIDRQMYARAREELDALLRNDPANQEYLALHATTCALLGEHAGAITSPIL